MSKKQRMLTITWLLPAILLCTFSIQAEPPEGKGKFGQDLVMVAVGTLVISDILEGVFE